MHRGAVPTIEEVGFVSIVNLRRATEAGAKVEKEEAAAKAAGLRYFHVPFDGTPDPGRGQSVFESHHLARGQSQHSSLHQRQPSAATMWLMRAAGGR